MLVSFLFKHYFWLISANFFPVSGNICHFCTLSAPPNQLIINKCCRSDRFLNKKNTCRRIIGICNLVIPSYISCKEKFPVHFCQFLSLKSLQPSWFFLPLFLEKRYFSSKMQRKTIFSFAFYSFFRIFANRTKNEKGVIRLCVI